MKRSLVATSALLLLLTQLASCTFGPLSTDSDSRSATVVRRAPFYLNYARKGSIDPGRSVACPNIAIDARTVSTFGFFNGREISFAPLLTALNEHLHRLGRCSEVTPWDPLEAGAPDLYAGSGEAASAPFQYDRKQGETYPPMILSASSPSKQWREKHARRGAEDPDFLLIIRVGIAEYPKTSKFFFDDKVVLGTRNQLDLSFLGRDDNPVYAVQLTAMLLDRACKVLRVGAEGIAAKRPKFLLDVVGLAETYQNYELATLPTEPREDLPGKPLKWQVALDQLMAKMLEAST